LQLVAPCANGVITYDKFGCKSCKPQVCPQTLIACTGVDATMDENKCPTCRPHFPPIRECPLAKLGVAGLVDRDYCLHPSQTLDASGCPVCLPRPQPPNPCPRDNVLARLPCDKNVDTTKCPTCFIRDPPIFTVPGNVKRSEDQTPTVENGRVVPTSISQGTVNAKICASRISNDQLPPCISYLGEEARVDADGCPTCIPPVKDICATVLCAVPRDCDYSVGEYPIKDPSSCCRSCKHPLESVPKCPSVQALKEALTKIPTCTENEKPITTGCVPSCRIREDQHPPLRVAECEAVSRPCELDEKPIRITDRACPHCDIKQTVDSKCVCASGQVGVSEIKNGAVDSTTQCRCHNIEHQNFDIFVRDDAVANAINEASGRVLRHRVHEHIRKFCDNPKNINDCKVYEKYLRVIDTRPNPRDSNSRPICEKQQCPTGAHCTNTWVCPVRVNYPAVSDLTIKRAVQTSMGVVVNSAMNDQSDPNFAGSSQTSLPALSVGAIAGIVVGAVVGALIIIAIIGVAVYMVSKNSNKESRV
jgi:hypothetical protein